MTLPLDKRKADFIRLRLIDEKTIAQTKRADLEAKLKLASDEIVVLDDQIEGFDVAIMSLWHVGADVVAHDQTGASA